MKQHITQKQWDELDGNQQFKLLKDLGLLPAFASKQARKLVKKLYVAIGIGQMIEFLGDDWYEDLIKIDFDTLKGNQNKLCDALWKAVKDKLK